MVDYSKWNAVGVCFSFLQFIVGRSKIWFGDNRRNRLTPFKFLKPNFYEFKQDSNNRVRGLVLSMTL